MTFGLTGFLSIPLYQGKTTIAEALGEALLLLLGWLIWKKRVRADLSALKASVHPLVFTVALFYLAHVLFQGKTAISESTAGIGLILLGWAVWKRYIAVSFHILYFPLAIYGLASSVSSITAGKSVHHWGQTGLWVKMLIFPMAIMLFREIPRLRVMALFLHLFYGSAVALIGLYQFAILGWRDLDHRISGVSTHVMTYSGMLLPLGLLALILWIHERKPLLLVPTCILTLALLLTFTRSAWLGWLVSVGTLLVLRRSRWLAYAAPILLLFITFLPLPLFSRLMSTFDPTVESNVDRIRMAEAGVEIIKDYPILGVGPANIKEYYPVYRRSDSPRFRVPHLHNNVIQIWAERGVIALAGYVLLIGLFLRECARGWNGPGKKWAEAGVAIAVGLTYAGLFEFNFGDTEVFYLTLDLFALICVSLESQKSAGGAGLALRDPSPPRRAGEKVPKADEGAMRSRAACEPQPLTRPSATLSPLSRGEGSKDPARRVFAASPPPGRPRPPPLFLAP